MNSKSPSLFIIILLLIFFTFSCPPVTGQITTTFIPAEEYKGDLNKVVRVIYQTPIFAKKKRGVFLNTGSKTWKETSSKGEVVYWMELYRRKSCISLVDTVGGVRFDLDLLHKQINKPRKGFSGEGWYSIIYIEEAPEGSFYEPVRQSASSPQYTQQQPTGNALGVTAPVPTLQATAGQVEAPAVKVSPIPELMNSKPVYHAILIGENTYEDKAFNPLPGTLNDVRKIYHLLTTKYTFETGNVDTMMNSSKASILRRINAVAKNMAENDNLLIFYAGHGWLKKYNDGTGRQEGFLVPSDASKGEEVSFIDNQDIGVILKRSNAKHILFIADACFAGALFRDLPDDTPVSVAEAYKDKSRKLLSSGNEQAVSDESDFVEYLRLALQENRTKYITAMELVNSFRKDYSNKTNMQLQYVPIQNVDDHGGEFVFIRR